MRYLIDTNIFIFVATDPCRLSRDVKHILSDYETQVCISMESVKELIVAYKNRGFDMRKWHSADEFIRAVRDDYHFTILPIGIETMETYSRPRLNVAEEHWDPSDHVIISQALTEKLPLISSDHKFLFYRKQGLDLIYNE